mgnify:CR=1 FL=1
MGSDEALNQLATLVGEREEGELPLSHTQEIESLLLTKKDMINKQLGDLNLMKNFGCTVTRVRRSGIDLAPSPDLALKFGDKLTVVGEKEGLKGLARLLGNNAKKLSDTDFFPIAMGIVLGVLFGKLNISFGGGVSFSPGLTGGILMMALFLSAIGKTGPIIWSMSGPANQLLRQLGLLLFLAEVGTSAGKTLVSTFQESGFLLFGVGATITLVPMLLAALVGRLVFKISMLDLLGTITGGMTSTPGLAAADSRGWRVSLSVTRPSIVFCAFVSMLHISASIERMIAVFMVERMCWNFIYRGVLSDCKVSCNSWLEALRCGISYIWLMMGQIITVGRFSPMVTVYRKH